MKRDLVSLSSNTYDVLVVGGGIYGVWIAWDAILRGLSVALLEKGDFASGTSSNSLKIMHGGLRYLQQADFRRMRESIHERTTLMRVAPHLVHPLPFLIPTYGHALRGKEALFVALLMNDLIGFDRNQALDPQKHIPKGRVVTKEECLRLLPGINSADLTGGAIWYDCQLHNSERMLLAIIRSATEAGADVANYTEATGLLKTGDRVTGVRAKDRLTDEEFDIHARAIVNASGPSVQTVLKTLCGAQHSLGLSFSKAINLVLKRQIFPTYGVGISDRKRTKDAVSAETGGQWLFVTPWRSCSIVGTLHLPYDGDPLAFHVTEQDVERLLTETNAAYPPAALSQEDVAFVHGGLLPVAERVSDNENVALLKRYQIIDHARHGNEGVISVVGVKYTTARDVAQKTVNVVVRKLEKKTQRCLTAEVPVHGGEIERFADFLADAVTKQPYGLSNPIVHRLVHTYGSAYPRVLKFVDENPVWGQTVANSLVLQAEVIHGVREEMAQKLIDVIFRRTDLGTAGYPGEDSVRTCAAIMAAELHWDAARTSREIAEVNALFAAHHAKVPVQRRHQSTPLNIGPTQTVQKTNIELEEVIP